MINNAFTLIEMSIVLVIIGLIVGGVLVGRDLVDAASMRAQISQIEKYNTAVHTFQNKYGYLPGDIPDPYASNFGFQARGTLSGQGDGNGIIWGANGSGGSGNKASGGEAPVFWVDLSAASLIDGGFNTAKTTTHPAISGATIPLYFPYAKIGNGNYIYVYDGGYYNGTIWVSDGYNYYGVASINSTNGTNGQMISNVMLTVQQAYTMDSKIDDSLPQSGNVQAFYLNWNISPDSIAWAAGGGVAGANNGNTQPGATTSATNATATTCYDNSNSVNATGVNGQAQHYSLGVGASPNNQNCALSFRFQ